jgi:hypothetical protein
VKVRPLLLLEPDVPLWRYYLNGTRIDFGPITISAYRVRASTGLRRLDARMKRLESMRAETDKTIADSKARIAQSLAVLDRSPSLVPEA